MKRRKFLSRKTKATTWSILIFGMALSGTTACSSPDETSELSLSPEYQTVLDIQIEQYRDALLAQYPEAAVPDVQTIRLVTLNEWPETIAACVTEKGFPAEATPDGGVDYTMSQQQANPLYLAMYECKVAYPVHPKYQAPLTEAQATMLYEYYTTTLTSCLEEFGVVVDAPPSFAVFAEELQSPDSWSPYKNVFGGSNLQTILADCPQAPPDLYK